MAFQAAPRAMMRTPESCMVRTHRISNMGRPVSRLVFVTDLLGQNLHAFLRRGITGLSTKLGRMESLKIRVILETPHTDRLNV